MNEYQKEQAEALSIVRKHFRTLNPQQVKGLKNISSDYFSFRKTVSLFLTRYFSTICDQKCYRSQLSACCSKDGIITFFADVVLNALVSSPKELDTLAAAIEKPRYSNKCIYLGPAGCLWCLKPVICEMFLCESAKKAVFDRFSAAASQWEKLESRKKRFTWPDRPVLFDYLEQIFLDAGYFSPLMYMNSSPGLLRIKKTAMLSCP
jgi:hypothetical protein